MNKINKGLLTIALLVPMVKPEEVIKTNIITDYNELLLERYEREYIKENKEISKTSEYIYDSEEEAINAANNELEGLRDLDVTINTDSKEIANGTFDTKSDSKTNLTSDEADKEINNFKSDYETKGYTITKAEKTLKTREVVTDELEVVSEEKIENNNVYSTLEDANKAKEEIESMSTDKKIYTVNINEETKTKTEELNKKVNNESLDEINSIIKDLENQGYTVNSNITENKSIKETNVEDLNIELVFSTYEDANKAKEELSNKYDISNVTIKTNKKENTKVLGSKTFNTLTDAQNYINANSVNTDEKIVTLNYKEVNGTKTTTETKAISETFETYEEASKRLVELQNQGYDVSNVKMDTVTTVIKGSTTSTDISTEFSEVKESTFSGTYYHLDVDVATTITEIKTTSEKVDDNETVLSQETKTSNGTLKDITLYANGKSITLQSTVTKDENGKYYEYKSKEGHSRNSSLGLKEGNTVGVSGKVTYTSAFDGKEYTYDFSVNGTLIDSNNECGGKKNTDQYGFDLLIESLVIENNTVYVNTNAISGYKLSGNAILTKEEKVTNYEVSGTETTYTNEYSLEGSVKETIIDSYNAELDYNKEISYNEYTLDVTKTIKDNKVVNETYYEVELEASKENTDTKYNYSYEGNYNIYDIENIYGKLEVHYVDENGNDLINPIYDEQLVGNKYNTTYNNEIGKYEFKEVKSDSASTNGEYVEGTTVVTYVYTKKSGTVITHYVDKEGNKLLDDKSLTNKVDTEYQTVKEIITDYNFVEVIGNENGIITEGTTEITYVYDKKEGNVVIKYQDKDGNDIEESTIIEKVKVGEEYNTEAKEIEDYNLVEEPVNKEGTITEGTTEVIYVYDKKEGNVVVRYVDENGKDIIDPEVRDNQKVGENYNTESKEFNDYNLKETPSNKEGTITEGTIEVIYTYEKKEGNIVIKYQDENGNNIIDPEVKENQKVGETYSTESIDLKDYELVETPSNKEGTITEGSTEVIYTYKKKEGNVIVHYVDENNNDIIDPEVRDNQKVGETYSTESIEFDDYELVETPSNKEGTIVEGSTEVTYVYTKKEGTVVVKYQDEDGNDIIDPIVINKDKYGTEYTTDPIELEDYEVKEIPSNKDGEINEEEIEVIYVYELKKVNIEVIHVMDDNTSISDGKYDESKESIKIKTSYHKNAIDMDDQINLNIIIRKAEIYVGNELIDTLYNTDGLEYVEGIASNQDIKIVFTYEKSGIGDSEDIDNPKTGDNTLIIMTSLMFISLSVMAILTKELKKLFK